MQGFISYFKDVGFYLERNEELWRVFSIVIILIGLFFKSLVLVVVFRIGYREGRLEFDKLGNY